jgi:hypothetical protein
VNHCANDGQTNGHFCISHDSFHTDHISWSTQVSGLFVIRDSRLICLVYLVRLVQYRVLFSYEFSQIDNQNYITGYFNEQSKNVSYKNVD